MLNIRGVPLKTPVQMLRHVPHTMFFDAHFSGRYAGRAPTAAFLLTGTVISGLQCPGVHAQWCGICGGGWRKLSVIAVALKREFHFHRIGRSRRSPPPMCLYVKRMALAMTV
jgi:hypothetical protein